MANQTMVRATLKSTYGYFNPAKGIKENFGPGENILIPWGLAYSLGLLSVDEAVAAASVAEPTGDDLTVLGLRADTLTTLQEAGFTTFAAIAAATVSDLTAVKGIGEATAARIQVVAQEQVANGGD